MSDLELFLKISRPRFWIYILGPYLVGLAAGINSGNELLKIKYLLFGAYFILPANLLIYGINDVFDYKTDKLNPKKRDYELLVKPAIHRKLLTLIFLLNIPFVVLAGFYDPNLLAVFAGFLFFAVFYSAPPVRAKAIPFLDSAFNVLYVFPGIFAYTLASGIYPMLAPVAAAGFWTMAMHAFSAIPDIPSDRAAGLNTIATLLGSSGTLVFCLACYAVSGLLAFDSIGVPTVLFLAAYVLMIIVSFLLKKNEGVFRIYKLFPLLNTAVGLSLFWLIAFRKFA